MFTTFSQHMSDAKNLTAAGRLKDATASIQRALRQQSSVQHYPSPGPPNIADTNRQARGMPLQWSDFSDTSVQRTRASRGPASDVGQRTRNPSPEMINPRGAQFLSLTFCNDAGSRSYKLYVPASYRAGVPVPLLVMLHGCTQTPDDFAAGTRMNQLADVNNFLVAYPEQTRSANTQKCWNWFNAADQSRGAGEPSLIAGITRQIMAEYTVDEGRVFAAGLSAGGAAAAVMGQVYPDLYSAIGVHSGLACGAARDLPSAFAAMRQGAGGQVTGPCAPAIIFHGDRDTTVSPRNGDAIVAQSTGSAVAGSSSTPGRVPGGRSYARTVHRDKSGRTVAEHWVVHGAGHSWSGGSSNGSYTDPLGPDASAEMIRFFMEITA